MAKTNIFIVYYSMFGHVRRLAAEIKNGIETVPNVHAAIYQVRETLPDDILMKMKAAPKGNDPIIEPADLSKADGVMFGLPTRFGAAPAQMKALLDGSGSLWLSGALVGKTAGVFFSTATQGGGQETTALSWITQLAHHGMIYVPLGYVNRGLMNMEEIHGGSPYGAGTMAGPDGSRQPSALEISIARSHGEHFAKRTRAMVLGCEAAENERLLRLNEENPSLHVPYQDHY